MALPIPPSAMLFGSPSYRPINPLSGAGEIAGRRHRSVIALVPGGILRQIPPMGRLITRRIITALLSISFALGVAMSNAQAASMTVQMAMSAGMGMSGSPACGGCGGTEKSDMKMTAACDQNCVAPLAAILPATLAMANSQSVRHVPAPTSPQFDRAPIPDPSPPRS